MDDYSPLDNDELSEYDIYGKTPPRTKILRKNRERKQRDKTGCVLFVDAPALVLCCNISWLRVALHLSLQTQVEGWYLLHFHKKNFYNIADINFLY